MANDHTERFESSDEQTVVELSARFWDLARSDLPNGIAMIEMAQILQDITEASNSSPIVIVQSLRPEPTDPNDFDPFDVLRVAYLAQNFWTSTYLKFDDRKKPYLPEGYSPERDELQEGKTKKLEVRGAGEAGRGLYAREKISEGETVFVASGERKFFCSPYESRSIVEELRDGKRHFSLQQRNPDQLFPNAICVGQEDLEAMVGLRIENPAIQANVWLDPSPTSPLRFLNHSCAPNITRTVDGVSFVALRDIKADEQVTCDYATLEVNPDWSMECKCGAPQCRGVIGGIQSLPNEHLETYGLSLPNFMLRLFRATHTEIDTGVLRKNDLLRWILR